MPDTSAAPRQDVRNDVGHTRGPLATSTPTTARARKPRRHLMVPGQPGRPTPTAASTARVQRWVLSILSVTLILHLAAGLVVAAVVIDPAVPSSRIGLLVIAAVLGVIAVGSALVIHRHSLVTPWLALGLAPALLGAYLCFGR